MLWDALGCFGMLWRHSETGFSINFTSSLVGLNFIRDLEILGDSLGCFVMRWRHPETEKIQIFNQFQELVG